LEAVAQINTAIRLGNAVETVEELLNPEAQLPIVYQSAANLYQAELFSLQLQGGRVRYADMLIEERAETLSKSQEFLTWNDVQKCIDMVNIQVQEEHERIIAIAEINEALNSGDPQQTLAALLLPTAKLTGVNPATAQHYHDVLHYTKRRLCQVA
ncbi:hypothetical protein XENOCAPTIV_001687, partial [Xenoophorus captivus]